MTFFFIFLKGVPWQDTIFTDSNLWRYMKVTVISAVTFSQVSTMADEKRWKAAAADDDNDDDNDNNDDDGNSDDNLKFNGTSAYHGHLYQRGKMSVNLQIFHGTKVLFLLNHLLPWKKGYENYRNMYILNITNWKVPDAVFLLSGAIKAWRQFEWNQRIRKISSAHLTYRQFMVKP